MRLSHSLTRTSAVFDDPNLVSHGGLVPVMALAERAGLPELLAEHVRPGGECGVNAHLKVGCLVAGMTAGADSIDDMGLLRHGAMDALFGGVRAPSTLGSHLRSYAWGNVLQIEKGRPRAAGPALARGAAAARRRCPGLHRHRLDAEAGLRAQEGRREVRPHENPGQVRAGPRAERAHRRGEYPAGGAGGRRHQAARREHALVPRRGGPGCAGHRDRPRLRLHRDHRRADGLRLLRCGRDRRDPPQRRPVLRHRPGDRRHQDRDHRHPRSAWTAIEYPQAVWDDQLDCWVSDAEIAETTYTAFTSKKKELHVTARLIVRRVRDKAKAAPGQGELFPAWRYHAVFTDSPYELAQAEGQHRGHAVIEQPSPTSTTAPWPICHMLTELDMPFRQFTRIIRFSC